MRHFYTRTKINVANNTPWKNCVTPNKEGIARVPIGSVALDFDMDGQLLFSCAFVSEGDNFKYNTAKNVCRGRLTKGDCFILDPHEFAYSIKAGNAFNIFKLIGVHHKYLKYINPELFTVSARACFKKLCQDHNVINKFIANL